MNKKDLQILAYLRQNARMPLTKMSRKTGIPVSTIFDRLRSNEDGLIVKHTTLLNFAKLGFNTRANIHLKVCGDDKDALKNFLLKHHAVNSVYKINNGFDILLEGVFKQVKDMEEFIEMLENKFRIEDKKIFFVIEDLKKEDFMSNPDLCLM